MGKVVPTARARDLVQATEAAVRDFAPALEAARASVLELQKTLRAEPDSAAVIHELLLALRLKAQSLGTSSEVVDSLARSWGHEANLEANGLQSSLEALVTRLGWSLDGAWPSYMVERAVNVEFSADRGTVVVGGQRIAPASLVRVQAALERIVPELLPRAFDPRAFLEQLRSAVAKTRTDGPVPVMAVYREFVVQQQSAAFWRDVRKERFTALSIHQFRARLTASLDALSRRRDLGTMIRLSPPLKPEDGLFLYTPSEQRFALVGSIEVLREESA